VADVARRVVARASDDPADGGDGLRSTGRRAQRHHESGSVGHPVKVYARAAGQHHIDMWHLAGWTLLERGLRISTVGLVVWLLSKLLHPLLRRLYGVYLIIVGIVFTAGLSAVIAAWS